MISEAWQILSRDMATWILALIVIAVVAGVPYGLLQIIVRLVVGGPNIFLGGPPLNQAAFVSSMRTTEIVNGILIIPFLGLAWILTTGAQKMALKLKRGQSATLGDIFNLEGTGKTIFAYGALLGTISCLSAIAQAFLMDPLNPFGLFAIGPMLNLLVFSVIGLFINAVFGFTPLIIADQKLPLGDALRLSYRTFLPHVWQIMGVLLVTGLAACVGIIGCLIGVILTLPISIIVPALIYHNFFRPATSDVSVPSSTWP